MSVIIDKLARQYANGSVGFYKVNVEETDIASYAEVDPKSVPLFIVYKHGARQEEQVAGTNIGALEVFVKRNIY